MNAFIISVVFTEPPLSHQDQNIWHIFGKDRIWRFNFLAADNTHFKNVTVVNSPSRVYSVSNPAPLVMTNLIVDNCKLETPETTFQPYAHLLLAQGDVPNTQSNGLPAGMQSYMKCAACFFKIWDRPQYRWIRLQHDRPRNSKQVSRVRLPTYHEFALTMVFYSIKHDS
jgi:hypothetical protein